MRAQIPTETATPETLLLNAHEAARLLSISPRSLWTLANRGIVPTVRIGHKMVRWDRADLVALIAKLKSGGE